MGKVYNFNFKTTYCLLTQVIHIHEKNYVTLEKAFLMAGLGPECRMSPPHLLPAAAGLLRGGPGTGQGSWGEGSAPSFLAAPNWGTHRMKSGRVGLRLKDEQEPITVDP